MALVLVQCDCPTCVCNVDEIHGIRKGHRVFCSQSCADGHPNNEPCHGTDACGCDCGGQQNIMIYTSYGSLSRILPRFQ